ncbi:hypothetical protein L6452_36174 [Arctium lappa]|uniref:Uncharacterized protein n=1 Tax=Arctium lappa TaxID=4217 RepID=A0ACB8Y7V1_ARCLA|nr:hypothetical protein L6452_36174 [Arctium lappa]
MSAGIAITAGLLLMRALQFAKKFSDFSRKCADEKKEVELKCIKLSQQVSDFQKVIILEREKFAKEKKANEQKNVGFFKEISGQRNYAEKGFEEERNMFETSEFTKKFDLLVQQRDKFASTIKVLEKSVSSSNQKPVSSQRSVKSFDQIHKTNLFYDRNIDGSGTHQRRRRYKEEELVWKKKPVEDELKEKESCVHAFNAKRNNVRKRKSDHIYTRDQLISEVFKVCIDSFPYHVSCGVCYKFVYHSSYAMIETNKEVVDDNTSSCADSISSFKYVGFSYKELNKSYKTRKPEFVEFQSLFSTCSPTESVNVETNIHETQCQYDESDSETDIENSIQISESVTSKSSNETKTDEYKNIMNQSIKTDFSKNMTEEIFRVLMNASDPVPIIEKLESNSELNQTSNFEKQIIDLQKIIEELEDENNDLRFKLDKCSEENKEISKELNALKDDLFKQKLEEKKMFESQNWNVHSNPEFETVTSKT